MPDTNVLILMDKTIVPFLMRLVEFGVRLSLVKGLKSCKG